MRLICVHSLYLYLLGDKRKTLVCRHELTGGLCQASSVNVTQLTDASRGGPALQSASIWTHLSDTVESHSGTLGLFPLPICAKLWRYFLNVDKNVLGNNGVSIKPILCDLNVTFCLS